jgi:MerR family transcriptional regulator, light-induced transcriptional regulator
MIVVTASEKRGMTVHTNASGARMISLQEAADRLGVHYMTVYRYVRTGRLPAVKEAGEWRVDRAAVDQLRRRHAGPRPREPRRVWSTRRLLDRLVAGDEQGTWQLVEAALSSGADPSEVHLDLIAPALRAIGDRWEAGELTVAEEHRASVVARRVISRLGTRFTRRGRKRGTVVLGAIAGERHEIPGSIVADHLRRAGFEVVDLGADTPVESFVGAARQHAPMCVLLSVTGKGHDQVVVETAAALEAIDVPVLVGGAAVPDEVVAVGLGSRGWTGTDARQVVACVEELVGRPVRR